MRPKSIRWQLPLSYAGIALISTLALGLVLLVILRDYYMQRELDYLNGNAGTLNQAVTAMLTEQRPLPVIQAQLASYSFLSQVRVRLLDEAEAIIADSGIPSQRSLLSISAQPNVQTAPPPTPPNRAYDNNALYALDPYVDLQDYRTRIDLPIGIPVEDRATGERVTTYFVPVISLERIYPYQASDDAELQALRNEAQTSLPSNSAEFTSVLAATSTLSGFSLSDEVEEDGRRSDQRVRQALFDTDGAVIGYIELSDGPAYGRQIVGRVAQAWFFASVLAVSVSAFGGWQVSRRITVPLMELTETTTRMARGDLSVRAYLDRDDELGQLAAAFNEMAHRVEEIVVTLRRFVADAAHELHTPLTALHTNLELAEDELHQKTRQNYIERARSQVKRLQTLTDGLLNLSRMESGTATETFGEVCLSALVQEVSELYASRSEQAGINFALSLPPEPIVLYGSAGQLRNALGNLLDNAIKFSPEGETISVTLRRHLNALEVMIQDRGIGIPPDDLPLVFSRFHRARNAVEFQGSGLGLAIVKAVVESHHGQISIENTTPGLRVVLRLPVVIPVYLDEKAS
ncbi:MAG: HAMP domain-containing sensor histidine kinase [bacterium]|nr:HAMP domain-containing sensor histidine kinase [bacterium]